MLLDEKSVKAIFGTSGKAVVFGFTRNEYEQVCKAINKIEGIEAVYSDGYQYLNSTFDKGQSYIYYNFYKYILNDLVLENYQKSLKGEAIILLIFIIGKNKKEYSVPEIDTKSQYNIDKWITLTELGRCYKLASEFGSDLEEIANQTFKFIKLNPSNKGYKFELIEPFWKKEEKAKKY